MKLNPKAEPRGDLDEASNWDNFTDPARRDPRAAGRARSGRDHPYLDHLPRSRAASVGAQGLGQSSGNASPHVLGRQQAAGGRGPAGRFLRQLLRQAQRSRQHAGHRGQRHRLQLLLADALPQVGPYRNRQRERKAASACCTTISTGSRRTRLPDDTPYFYAQYRQEYPVKKGQDYVFLETKGKGHYVGTVLAVRTRSPAWFGEGDEKIYIDGESKASIWGTGTEDYFLCAWGLRRTSTPYFGVPYFDQWGIVGGHTVGLPLAHQRSDRLQHRHQGQHRALRLASARRESAIPGDELERARRRLRQRGLLVSNRRIDLHGPRPHARQRRLPKPGTAHGAGGGFRAMPGTMARAIRRASNSICTRASSCSTCPSRPPGHGSRFPSR